MEIWAPWLQIYLHFLATFWAKFKIGKPNLTIFGPIFFHYSIDHRLLYISNLSLFYGIECVVL